MLELIICIPNLQEITCRIVPSSEPAETVPSRVTCCMHKFRMRGTSIIKALMCHRLLTAAYKPRTQLKYCHRLEVLSLPALNGREVNARIHMLC
jgi:hypothetical protein